MQNAPYPTKMYGKLWSENVLTQAKMQPHSDSRTKEKCTLGEKQVTLLVRIYLVPGICFISGKDDNGMGYFLDHEWGSAKYGQSNFALLCTRESKPKREHSSCHSSQPAFSITSRPKCFLSFLRAIATNKSLLGSLPDTSSQTQQLIPDSYFSYKLPQEPQYPRVSASVWAFVQCCF